MKGVVFTEYLEMVESKFGLEVQDKMLSQSDLSTEGIYTSVGTYDPAELVSMVVSLSEIVDVPVPELVKAFGLYLYGVFKQNYGAFLRAWSTLTTFWKVWTR